MMRKLIGVTLFMGLTVVQCGSDPNSLSGGLKETNAPADSTNTIVVMSYNILHGAGIDPQYDEISGAQGFPGNRVSKILGVIRAVDPDILGIQEALSWERDTPPFAEQFADSLGGLNYFLALSRGIHHVALYTKFRILQAVNFRDKFSRTALQATLEAAGGDTLQVFVAHIYPRLSENNAESNYLAAKAIELTGTKAVLMGDLNQLASNGPVGKVLKPAGWQVAGLDARIGIDHIWVSPLLSHDVQQLDPFEDFSISTELLDTASDHWPALANIRIR